VANISTTRFKVEKFYVMPAFLCLVQGGIEETGRRGRRRKQLLDDMKGCCKLKEEAIDRSLWRTGFGRAYGSAVRQTTE
jgi:hypothetical protein